MLGISTMGATDCESQGATLPSPESPPAPGSLQRYLLEVDGEIVAEGPSFSGGMAYSDVVTETLGPDQIKRKHLGALHYEDITFTATSFKPSLINGWVKSTLNRSYQRKNGAIIAADYDHKEVARLRFTEALIVGVGLPALDSTSHGPATLTLKLMPEVTKVMTPSGLSRKNELPEQKKWTPANFRMGISGLDSSLSKVSKIDAITIKTKVTQTSVGESRDYLQNPAEIEVPNFGATTPDEDSQALKDWAYSFIVQGMSDQGSERTATVDYETPDGQLVLRLSFQGVGIFKLSPDGSGSRSDLYAEQVSIDAP